MRLSELPLFSVGNTIQLVGAIYQGEGETLLCPLPGEDVGDFDFLSHLEMDAAEWDEFLRRTDLQEVEVTNGTAKAVARKTQRQIDTAITWKCFRRDHYTCCYCGRDDVPLTVDHLIVWEEGGPSIEANLLTACKKCNRTRGNTSYAAWLRHPYYDSVQGRLTPERRDRNIALVATLAGIGRVDRIKSR